MLPRVSCPPYSLCLSQVPLPGGFQLGLWEGMAAQRTGGEKSKHCPLLPSSFDAVCMAVAASGYHSGLGCFLHGAPLSGLLEIELFSPLAPLG